MTANVANNFKTGREIWPKEVWSKHVAKFEQLFDKDQVATKSVPCLNKMVEDTLKHLPAAVALVTVLEGSSLFRIWAFGVLREVASMEECYNNPKVFTVKEELTKIGLSLVTNAYLMIHSGSVKNFQKLIYYYVDRMEHRASKLPKSGDILRTVYVVKGMISVDNLEGFHLSATKLMNVKLSTFLYVTVIGACVISQVVCLVMEFSS